MSEKETGPVLPDVRACRAWAKSRPLPDPSVPTAIVMVTPSGGGYYYDNTEGDLEKIELLLGSMLWWGLNEIRLVRGMEGVKAFVHRLVEIAVNLDQPFRGSELAVFQPGEYELVQEFERQRK